MTRPIDCVACGGPKESQRGMVCDRCRTPEQRKRWLRQKQAKKLRRAIATSHGRSAPVAAPDHRYDGRELCRG